MSSLAGDIKRGEKGKVKHLFHPAVDFLCLGGAFLIVLPMMLFVSSKEQIALLSWYSLLLADFINHPHFAYSFQIFYRRFIQNLLDTGVHYIFKLRLLFAGVIVPAGLIVFFYNCFVGKNVLAIGYAANFMFFLVGWHYAKQGYGMLALDSALKKMYFNKFEKDFFRYNAHVCWFAIWVYSNHVVSAHELWGLEYFTFSFPSEVIYFTGILAGITTTGVIYLLFKAFFVSGRSLPVTGLMAYVVSIYAWLGIRNLPAVVIFIPAFHSLQYLTVVMHYELNRGSVKFFSKRERFLHFTLFILLGLALGYYGFWKLPSYALEATSKEYIELFGSGVFLLLIKVLKGVLKITPNNNNLNGD